jgi:hypothetical protein
MIIMKAMLNKGPKWHSAACFMVFLLLLGIQYARADDEIHLGTTIMINPGTIVFEYGNAAVLTGGDIDNYGTLIIKGNLVNGNTTTTDLGPGTIEFSGTAPQTITGLNIFGNLKLSNSSGLTILDDQRVNGALTLTSGLINLGTSGEKNLLLGPTASVAGTPSATAMVVVTGSGELRKEFAGLTSFTFPVGDADVTADYSPVTADFTQGTFGTDNYLGINLKNMRDPALATANYLNRYWTLNSSGITNINCNLTFNFVDTDVIGTKDDLYCLKTLPVLETYDKWGSGNQLTGTITSFNRFTGANIIDLSPNITAEPNVMHGETHYYIIVKVTELGYGSTNGLITVNIPIDTRWSLTFSPDSTMIGPNPVNNSVWNYSTDGPYHKFTSNAEISQSGISQFGFHAFWNEKTSKGSFTLTSQITSWSGGEFLNSNNADAESLDYFIY